MQQTKFFGIVALGCQIALGGAFQVQAQEASEASDIFVAGVIPNQRPANAPVITQMAKDDAWYQHALTGIAPPYPASFRFLEDQGAWFNPFQHPGATGPYDIRNWYGAD